jgi:RNA polymerase sigma factor (sigma-70 family)
MSTTKSSSTFDSFSLSDLDQLCQQAVDEYRRSRNNKTDSSSCVEILRRAARGENEAIGVILLISRPLIEKKCPHDLRQHCDDIVQNVNIRFIKKFRNQKNPFQVTTFPRYRVYLNTTVANVIYNVREKHPYTESLDQLTEVQGFEPVQPDNSQEIENLMLFEQLLALLHDPLEREIIRRRYGIGEKSADIAVALGLDLKKVYRIAERAVRRLKKKSELF